MKIKPNDNCPCNSGLKYKSCCQLNPEKLLNTMNLVQVKDGEFPVTKVTRVIPPFITKPSYADSGQPPRIPRTAAPCSPDVIDKMRSTCKIAAKILKLVCDAVKPGITTEELDDLAFNASIAEGAYPSPLNYHFFPKSICTSVNNIICHGIPNKRPLADGDIVNIDVTVFKD
ncbi:MAG: M24 family metallopeptidase, partial [Lentisphaeria bacterium]